ncbi:MAG: PEP-CTERM sorting domain-containing protein [Phycisphaeraceae bacterium]
MSEPPSKAQRSPRRTKRLARWAAALVATLLPSVASAINYTVIPILPEGIDPALIKKVKIDRVNSLGQAVGEFEFFAGPDPKKRALYWEFDFFAAGQGGVEVGFDPGAKEIKAKRISDAGLIAGERKGPGTFQEIDGKGNLKTKERKTAWVTFNDQLSSPVIELGGLFVTPGIVEVSPDDVSEDEALDNDVLVGKAKFLDGGAVKELSWIWSAATPNTIIELLPPPGTDKLKVKDINFHGYSVGEIETLLPGNVKVKESFVRDPSGNFITLPTLTGVIVQETKADRLNDSNIIVGEVKTLDAIGKHAVIWKENAGVFEIFDLGTLPDESFDGVGREFKAKRINEAGLVFGDWKGEFTLPSVGVPLEYDLGFFWTEAMGMQNLIQLADIEALVPGADTIKIKAKEFDPTGALIVGEYEYFLNGETFKASFLTNPLTGDTSLFTPQAFPDLTGLDEIKDIRYISPDGWILVNGKINDEDQALLLIPEGFSVTADAPEPATLSLAAMGMLALARRRRRLA